MPNWCSNKIVIKGDQREIERFLERAKGQGEDRVSDVCLESLIPTPKELLEGDGWYKWRLENWGSKWDLCEVYLTKNSGDGLLEIRYETAWSPICEAVSTLSIMFPDLDFYHEFIEQGVEFAGYETYRRGELIGSMSEIDFETKEYRRIQREIGWN